MKTATVRQLRTEFPRIEGWLAEGENVLITKHNVVVAQLAPPPPKKKNPDFKKRFSLKGWKPPKKTINAVSLLIEERGT